MVSGDEDGKPISFATKTFTLRISESMLDDASRLMRSTRIYTNNADFILCAIHWFNQYTVDFLLGGEYYDDKPSLEFEERISLERKRIISEAYYYVNYMEKNRYQKSVSFRITDGFIQYCNIINEFSWNLASTQDYMRAAIAYYLSKMRRNRGKAHHILPNELTMYLLGFKRPNASMTHHEDENILNQSDD